MSGGSYIGNSSHGIISSIDGGTISNATLASSNKIESLVGMIAAFAMSSPPTGWLACQGQTLDSTTDTDYAPLFTAIGTTWGGTGSSSFLLPDLRGAFIRGTGSQPLVSSGGSGEKADGTAFSGPNVGSFENDSYQGHYHDFKAYGFNNHNNNSYKEMMYGNGTSPLVNTTSGDYVADSKTDGTNGTPRTDDETRPFNAGVLYCIRWK